MPALTLDKHSGVTYFSMASPDAEIEKYDNGTALLKGIKVFRTGTFRDSMGVQHTWESVHLEQMVFHFGLLRDNGIFTRVPWRDGHPSFFGSGGQVIGHFQDLRHEGDYLVADVMLTEPDAVGKWERGTFGPRSLEVGMYETNDEAAYWPVVMGSAFVDIAAVEGLFEKAKQQSTAFVTVDSEEAPVADQNQQTGNGQAPAAPAQPAPTQTPAGGEQAAPPAAPAAPSNPQVAPAQPVPVEQPAQHSAPTGGTFQFRINGAPTVDFAAVQAHIDVLEGAAEETRKQIRAEFVKGLAKDNKILANQIDELTEFAQDLKPEQYAKWAKTFDTSPANPLFAEHGNPGAGGQHPGSNNDPKADRIEVLEGIVAHHRRAGRSEDFIKSTDSYKELMVLKGNA